LALNVIPCNHDEKSNSTPKNQVTQFENHRQKHDYSELCSPFCLDENCHIHITFIEIEDFNLKINTKFFAAFDYTESAGYNILYSIFQPPQV